MQYSQRKYSNSIRLQSYQNQELMKYVFYSLLFSLILPMTVNAQDSLFYADPNPYEDSTTFVIQLMGSDTATITIYNRLGDTVAMPISNEPITGFTTIPFDGDTLDSGIYTARLVLSNMTEVISISKRNLTSSSKGYLDKENIQLIGMGSRYKYQIRTDLQIELINIYSLSGEFVQSIEKPGKILDLSQLHRMPRGVYLIHFQTSKGNLTKKWFNAR